MNALATLLPVVALGLGLCTDAARAGDDISTAGWVALGEQRLDEVRGGFIDASGLQVSFGIERAIYLNGELVTTTRLNVADLAAVSGGKSGATLTGGAALLQNGPGNLIDSGTLSASSLATVIQNSLNGQHIRSVTTVNATVNSLGIVKSIDLQHSVRGALTDALRR